ncbi:MAG TPA: CARDB domain-containing protein, partial [Kofleriaceae bacterium]|nr:CARDB domain-containing protein [Kofleriaceae bacterium]
FGEPSGGPLLALRLDGTQVLDAEPFVLAATTTRPAFGALPQPVAWDGEKFRVVYQQGGVNLTTRVGADGAVEPASPVGVSGGGPGVACQGPRCLIMVTRVGVPVSSFARLFDPAGPIGDLFPVPGPVGQEGDGSLFWDGARYWIAYTVPAANPLSFRGHVARVSADGELLDPDGIPISPEDAHVFMSGVGHDGPLLLVSYARIVPSGGTESFLTRVTPDGAVLDPAGVRIAGPPLFGLGLGCGPDTCLGVTLQILDRDFSGRAFRLDGIELLDPPLIDITTAPPAQAEASAAWTGTSYAVVWRDGRPIQTVNPSADPTSTIRGALLSPTMERVASLEIDRQRYLGCDGKAPSVAGAAGSAMVVWDACGHVAGQALGADGQPLGPAGDVDGPTGADAHPFATSSGQEYLVLWDHQESPPPRSIEARRLGPAGTPRSDRFQVTRNGSSPVAAFDGTNYLLVWQRPLSNRESRPDLFAARMSSTGTVLDADIPIATLAAIPESAQSVACGGGVCLVVWRHAAIQVRAVRVGPDGTVLDATPLVIAVDGPVATTSTTFDGEAFLVAWREETGAMRAAQVTPSGQIVAPGAFTINPADASAYRPAVVSNGAGHRVALYDRFDRTPGVVMRRVRARVIGAPATVPDAGVPDASLPDAGVADAALPDAAPPDAATPDAAPPDAAPPDAAPPTGDPDYVVAALGDPPAAAVSGASFSVGVTVHNAGGPASATSTTRFFLSVDTAVGGDRALTRTATVPPLAAGASDAQTVALSVPTGLASGSYFLLACADRGATVPESDDHNNCRASAGTVAVTGPDLVIAAVVDPPPSLAIGQSFPAGDSTRNDGTSGAATCAVAYYLSPTPTRGPGARRLSTTRSTGPIAAGAVSSGTVSEKVPSMAAGTYYLVACADVSSTVAELDEQNNCAAATGTTAVGATP